MPPAKQAPAPTYTHTHLHDARLLLRPGREQVPGLGVPAHHVFDVQAVQGVVGSRQDVAQQQQPRAVVWGWEVGGSGGGGGRSLRAGRAGG